MAGAAASDSKKSFMQKYGWYLFIVLIIVLVVLGYVYSGDIKRMLGMGGSGASSYLYR
jgi:hypothetical protein